LLTTLVGFGIYLDHAASVDVQEQAAAALEGELARKSASADVRRVAQWAVGTQDHGGLPFVIIDRAGGRIYAFDPHGRLCGTGPVVLGADQATPIAPAGRFVADTLASARNGDIVWANDKTQVTLHALTSEQAGKPPNLEFPQAQTSRDTGVSLHLDALFRRECLDALHMQPSIAYVLPTDSVAVDRTFGIAPANPAAAALRPERFRSPL
jgi:hypothetical protein